MVNLFGLGIFGGLVLVLISVISFYGNYNSINMQNAFAHVNCPMPSSSGIWGHGVDANGNSILNYTGFAYNYPNLNNRTLTLTYHNQICSQVHTPNGVDYNYGQPTVAIGVFYFLDDYLAEAGDRITNWLYIASIIMNPASFSINLDRNYTVSDMNPTAQGIIFATYAFAYVGVGGMVYKIASPFAS